MYTQKADVNDAKRLTALTIRSKSHWDYSPEQINLWKEDLTITKAYIEANEVYLFFEKAELIGYYSFIIMNETDLKLDNLFIDPIYIGKGHGSRLLKLFLAQAQKLDKQRIILDADPNAETFYKKHGFKVIGQLVTSIKNRFLPIMELNLSP